MIRATVRLRLATSPREILTNRELACVKLAYVICPPTLHSADENTTQKNTTQNQNAAETVMCDRYAAVDGSDDAEGTKAAPFNTAQRLVDSLSAGQVGCLRGGVYTDPDKRLVFNDGGKEGDRIILRSYPGETAEFRGSIHIPRGERPRHRPQRAPRQLLRVRREGALQG
jgi:hypothetical protein